jgi:predicted dehydrogenase
MEKPLALDLAECDDLVRLAEQNRLVLQVGHIERFNPAFKQATPYFSEPKYIDAARYGAFSFRSTDIGVVFDLMIHDLDLALAVVGAPVADVSAFGLALLGDHEDMARARLVFANGAIADFAASRVSYQARRQMQVWCGGSHINMDFATRTALVAQPAAVLRRGQFNADQLSPDEKTRLKEHFFEDLIPLRQLEAGGSNALLEEQRDFVAAIRKGCPPQVSGTEGREVVAVAERILASISQHRWSGDEQKGRVDFQMNVAAAGQISADDKHILRGPHWHRDRVPGELKRPA